MGASATDVKIETRLATAGDATIIALLGRITFRETFGHLFRYQEDLSSYLDYTFAVDKIRNGLLKAQNLFWISSCNTLPCGYAKVKLGQSPPGLPLENSCQLQKIYVLQEFIPTKSGQQLLEALERDTRLSGYQHLWLSVLNTNIRARKFYLKNNFQKVGTHPYSIGREDFQFDIMLKSLNEPAPHSTKNQEIWSIKDF